MRCLAKDPAQRPQTAQALLAELAACDDRPWTEPQARAWWTSWRARDSSVPGPSPTSRDRLQLSPTLLEVDVRARARSS